MITLLVDKKALSYIIPLVNSYLSLQIQFAVVILYNL